MAMLERLKAIFSKPAPTLAELQEGEIEIRKALDRAQEDYGDTAFESGEKMIGILASGDEKARLALRKRLEDAAARVRELETALVNVRKRIEQRTVEDNAAALAGRWKRTRELCASREKAAAKLQRSLEASATAWREMAALTKEISGVAPVVKPWRVLNAWHDALRSVSEAQVNALSDGGLGDRAAFPSLRFNTYAEYLREAEALPAVVERQHRQLLAGESAKPRPSVLSEAA